MAGTLTKSSRFGRLGFTNAANKIIYINVFQLLKHEFN